ncbi:hypothetical protein EDC96DRAFT_545549 [Choanephora cucurbitarum]|nr:hypothetical protein EDC96DRAFT_545549 [Choanephora cucurbitarum]
MIVSSGSSDELKQKQDNDMREFSSTSRVARQSKKEDKKKKNEKSARRIRCLSGSLIRSRCNSISSIAYVVEGTSVKTDALQYSSLINVMLKPAIAMSNTQVRNPDRKRTPKSYHRLQFSIIIGHLSLSACDRDIS